MKETPRDRPGEEGRDDETEIIFSDDPPCVHCRIKVARRPRQLCHDCWSLPPEVKSRYPFIQWWANDCLPDFCGPARGTCEPTDALPGTEAKIRVLRDRAQKGQALWHPLDVTGDEEMGRGRPAVRRIGKIRNRAKERLRRLELERERAKERPPMIRLEEARTEMESETVDD